MSQAPSSPGRSLLPILVAVVLAAACGDSATTTLPATATPTTVAPAAVTTTPSAPDSAAPPPSTTMPPTTTAAAATTTAPGGDATTTTAAPVQPVWRELPASDRPEVRSNAVAAVDAVAGVVYVHGGRTAGTARDDLWEYDLASQTWTEVGADGDRPEARYAHTAVWDEMRSRLVIFSGQAGPGRFLSDVWAFDPAVGAWEQLAPGGAGPNDRYGSCAGYDAAADRFLITHGFTDDGRFDDTWAFDLGAAAWTEVSPDGDRPLRRCLHTCAYDPVSSSLVLFGGQSNEAPHHGDTWVLGDTGWRELPGAAPSPRRFTTLAAVGATLALFGGTGDDGVTGDTWQLAVGGPAWTQQSSNGGPPPRHSHAAAATAAGLFVFGGSGSDGERNDLWELNFTG